MYKISNIYLSSYILVADLEEADFLDNSPKKGLNFVGFFCFLSFSPQKTTEFATVDASSKNLFTKGLDFFH